MVNIDLYAFQYLSIKACLIPVSALVKYLPNSSQAVSSISSIEILTSMESSLVAYSLAYLRQRWS